MSLFLTDQGSCTSHCEFVPHRAETGGLLAGKKKSLRAPSENEQALYLQRKGGPTEWMNCGKYNSSASSELKEIRR